MKGFYTICGIAMALCGCDARRHPAQQSATPMEAGFSPQHLKERLRQSPQQSAPSREKPSFDLRADESQLGGYVRFPAQGIRIRQPQEFDKADDFDGFGHEETNSSILITILPASFAQTAPGFTREFMKTRGWTFLGRQEIKVDDLPGILVHFEQPAFGDVYRKWSLLFGDEQKTRMVTATFPKALEGQFSARLKAAVLSVRLDLQAGGATGDAPESLPPFTLVVSPKLKRLLALNRALGYSKHGVLPAKVPEEPLFIAAPSLGKVVVGDPRLYAERRLKATAGAKQISIKSTVAITIDGLEGYESLAEAVHDLSGKPLVVYQVMLFNDGAYILMIGMVSSEERAIYLPEFKAMARSLKRKP